jgi:hypothetical protein
MDLGESVDGGCDGLNEKDGQEQVVVRVRASAEHGPIVRVAHEDHMTLSPDVAGRRRQ